MSCSYRISLNDKTGKEIATYSQNQINCKKNQIFTVDYNNSKPLTFQTPWRLMDTVNMTIITDQNQ